MLPAKHFYMIRHGQTDANANHIMAGHLDSPLTDLGRAQAETARKVVEDLPIKPVHIIHSHLSRARDTANIINTNLNLEMTEDGDIAEIFSGDWEGVSYIEQAEIAEGWATSNPPNGETWKEFTARVHRAKQRALEIERQGPVLIVSHGGVFRAFGKIYKIETRSGFKNCHLYEFMPNPKQDSFPWKVWDYDYEEETADSKIIRNRTDIFDYNFASTEEMASKILKA